MIKYRKKIKRGLLFLVMVFLSFVVNIPNISMIGTALKPFGGYMSDKSLFPSNPDFSMLRKVLFGTTFGRYLANSVFIALVVVVFCVVFAVNSNPRIPFVTQDSLFVNENPVL